MAVSPAAQIWPRSPSRPRLQATIAARIDRLGSRCQETLNAAAVIGSRFTPELLAAVGNVPALDALLAAALIDQVRFTPSAEFAFHHPLIRAVAYESQLRVRSRTDAPSSGRRDRGP